MAATSRMASCSAYKPVVSRSSATRIGGCLPINVPCAFSIPGSDRPSWTYRPIFKQVTSRLSRASTMANLIFQGRVHFSRCLTKLWHEKEGIVAKTVLSARIIGDNALNRALDNTGIARWLGQGNRATETRGPLGRRNRLQTFQDQAETLRIGCFAPGKTRGINTR